jgi:hydrogenase maturation factor HypF (carbamoyltransferase family)
VLNDEEGVEIHLEGARPALDELLLQDVKSFIAGERLDIWTNCSAPPNDGGVSLGHAALAAFAYRNKPE